MSWAGSECDAVSPHRHLVKAEEVEQSAGDALTDSGKSLALMRGLMSRENQVKELLGNLNTM